MEDGGKQEFSTVVLFKLNCVLTEQYIPAPLGGPYAMLLMAFGSSNITSKQYFLEFI